MRSVPCSEEDAGAPEGIGVVTLAAQDPTPDSYAFDIAICIDTGTSMRAALPVVQDTILAALREIDKAMRALGRSVIRQRMRVISFGNGELEHTPFYSFPEDAYTYESAIRRLEVRGRSDQLDAIAALHEAIGSDWEWRPDAAHTGIWSWYSPANPMRQSPPANRQSRSVAGLSVHGPEPVGAAVGKGRAGGHVACDPQGP